MKRTELRDGGMLLGAMLIFGTIGIFRRYIPLSSSLLACTRGFLGSAVLLMFVKVRGGKVFHGIGTGKTLLLALTGGLMGFNWILLFEAYNYTSVATATLCYYMEPTIVMLLSPLLFQEKITRRKLFCMLVSIIGMVLVSGITESGGVQASDLKGILLGLSAAALYASVVILNKKVKIEDAYEKTILQLFSAAVILIPYVLLTENPDTIRFTPLAVIMVLIVGIVHTGIAYAMYFSALNGVPAQTAAILSYTDPVSALLLSALILRESMSIGGMIGAVLIIGAAVLCELPDPASSTHHAS